jgi:hypothetical protein
MKRVTDVSGEYDGDAAPPASDTDIARIKREAVALKTGRVERDVDALLHAKGLPLDQTLSGTGRKSRLR